MGRVLRLLGAAAVSHDCLPHLIACDTAEQALLGCSVMVLEQRTTFSRLNVLHLWDFVEADLIDLGMKSLDASAFTSADFKHVSTCQMQAPLKRLCVLKP